MLQRFQLTHFRNYSQQDFVPATRLSVICGENGSGKTSLLEGLYLLGTGRSFRTAKLGNVVEKGQLTTTLFAQISSDNGVHRIGISRDHNGLIDARIDGERVHGFSAVARMLPVQVLHPGTVQLIEGGPSERRRFLDWLMFHVEPEFLGHWQRLREAVSQRNRLLKIGSVSLRELRIWDQQVAAHSARIDQLRRKLLPALETAFTALLQRVDGGLGEVSLVLQSGCAQTEEIEQALLTHREQDLRRGFTSVGAHRADLVIRSDKGAVREVFSRGQQKVVAYALVTAQIQMLQAMTGKHCLVLVDDLTSELDQGNEDRVLEAVLSTGNQAIVTTLDDRISLPYLAAEDVSLFHVEHGVLRPKQ